MAGIANATVRWKHTLPGLTSADLVTDGVRLFIPFGNRDASALCALDMETGEMAWRVPLRTVVACEWQSPLVIGDELWYGNWTTLLGIERRGGRILRSIALPHAWVPTTSPVCCGGAMMWMTNANTVHAIDIAPLAVHWVYDVRHGPSYGAPAVAGDRLFVPAAGLRSREPHDELLCLDARTGQPVWRCQWPQWDHQLCHRPNVAGGVLLVPADRQRRALMALRISDGEVLWRRTLNSLESPKPVWDFNSGVHVRGRVCYCPSPDGCLYAVSIDTGETLWRSCTRGAIERPPVEHAGRLFFGSDDGCLYVVDANSGATESSYFCGAAVRVAPVVLGDSLFVMAHHDFEVTITSLNLTDDSNGTGGTGVNS
jgi:outer membrane protein assembly factor BamB